MKIEGFEYSYDIESVQKVFNNPDVQSLFHYVEVSNKIIRIFKDKKRVSIAIKIYERVGWCRIICSEHTLEELVTFYVSLEPCISLTSSKMIFDLPDEFKEDEEQEETEEDVEIEETEEEQEEDVEIEETEEEQEEDVEEQDGSTFAKESVSYNADITEDVKQRAEVIKTTNAKRAALKKMKPNV